MLVFQEFGDHENVVKLMNVIKADNDKDIYLVFEYMGKYLGQFLVNISLNLSYQYKFEYKLTFDIKNSH
jgi:mitogen-activated protein kinase 15